VGQLASVPATGETRARQASEEARLAEIQPAEEVAARERILRAEQAGKVVSQLNVQLKVEEVERQKKDLKVQDTDIAPAKPAVQPQYLSLNFRLARTLSRPFRLMSVMCLSNWQPQVSRRA